MRGGKRLPPHIRGIRRAFFMNERRIAPTNITPQQKAVALKYEAERDLAPKVIAKGRGHVAEHILETAQKNSVPVYQDKTLVNMLMALEIDREIPPELYKAIAEVMAYVYKIDKSHGQAAAARRLAAQRRQNSFF